MRISVELRCVSADRSLDSKREVKKKEKGSIQTNNIHLRTDTARPAAPTASSMMLARIPVRLAYVPAYASFFVMNSRAAGMRTRFSTMLTTMEVVITLLN